MEKTFKGNEAVQQLLALWESGDLPSFVYRSVIRRQANQRPSDAWSMGNQILMMLHGTNDARGFKQWKEVGRSVNKGAKAFYILGPVIRNVERENTVTHEIETVKLIVGFRGIPVFAIEDTNGADIVYPDYSPAELPPLVDVAQSWGIDVQYSPFTGDSFGYYTPNVAAPKIVLQTHEAKVFFHELAHAADNRLRRLKGGQVDEQEIVAETVAAALALIYGFDMGAQTAARAYVASYAGVTPDEATKGVMRCLSQIQKVLDLILTTAAELAAAEGARETA